MARKQVNISLTEEQYELLAAAAWDAHETPAAFARTLVLEGLEPVEEAGEQASMVGIPSWLLAVLYLIRTGHRAPDTR